MRAVLHDRLERGDTVDMRGDGKAGGGLVLAIQAFGAAVASRSELDVQDWPLFSSARKGANVRAFLRIARGAVESACQVTRPQVAVLMNVAAAEEVDFAEGTDAGAIFVLNTSLSPEAAASRFQLSGTVATIDGDALGLRHLARPLGNVAVFAALVKATELVDAPRARISLARGLAKRRIPERLVAANLELFDEAVDLVHVVEIAGAASRARPRPFAGYGALPVGAQAALRSSLRNHTSGYGRPGVRITFVDPASRCNGCSLCVVQCPEGIIEFTADATRGAIVHGARFDDYCKACRECVVACPLQLFAEQAAVTRPEHAAGQPVGGA